MNGPIVTDPHTERWLAELRRQVRPRPHLRPELDRAALLVVDMVRYFCSPVGRSFLPDSVPIVPRIAALLERWRQAGGLVVYTRHGHQGEHDLGMLGRFWSDYIRRGEPQSEILAELAPRQGEAVLDKTTYDAFLGTGLEELLREASRDQVVVTGVLTHMCCETTARSAFCRGFEVYLPADALASSDEAHHAASLTNLADAVAVVLSTRELLDVTGEDR
jgi:bifunctional isochorismate lyase/aryl carrier protein